MKKVAILILCSLFKVAAALGQQSADISESVMQSTFLIKDEKSPACGTGFVIAKRQTSGLAYVFVTANQRRKRKTMGNVLHQNSEAGQSAHQPIEGRGVTAGWAGQFIGALGACSEMVGQLELGGDVKNLSGPLAGGDLDKLCVRWRSNILFGHIGLPLSIFEAASKFRVVTIQELA